MATASALNPNPTREAAVSRIPRLENGDHLTAAEFERRYAADVRLKKAELIDGVVHMPSPVRHTHHGKQHFDTICWLGRYVTVTPGIQGGDNSTLRLELASMPQPDVYLIILPEFGGQARIGDDGYIVGARS